MHSKLNVQKTKYLTFAFLAGIFMIECMHLSCYHIIISLHKLHRTVATPTRLAYTKLIIHQNTRKKNITLCFVHHIALISHTNIHIQNVNASENP